MGWCGLTCDVFSRESEIDRSQFCCIGCSNDRTTHKSIESGDLLCVNRRFTGWSRRGLNAPHDLRRAVTSSHKQAQITGKPVVSRYRRAAAQQQRSTQQPLTSVTGRGSVFAAELDLLLRHPITTIPIKRERSIRNYQSKTPNPLSSFPTSSRAKIQFYVSKYSH